MANVIPVQVRRETQRELQARFMIAGSLVAIAAALVAFLMFLPSYLTLAASPSAGSGGSALSQNDMDTDASQVEHVNALLHFVGPILATSSSPTAAVASVIALRPKGIHVDQIIYSSGKQSSLLLSGTADVNSAISDYRTALLSDARFTSVSVPVGALVGTDAGRFSITITGTF